MKTAALYIRVSTDMQKEYSLDSQLKLIKDYAQKHDMVLCEVYSDEGISGRTADKRPAFNRMIADAKKDKFNVILIYNTSRFARNHEESIVYRNMLKRDGIDVISITQPSVDYKTDILMNALYAVMDERYSIELSENVKRGMKEKASRGIYISCAPFGYDRVESKKPLVANEAESRIVKWMFDEYENGGSMFTMARVLNAKGYKAKRGNSFDRRGIHRILSNPVYKGYFSWTCDGETIFKKADHAPIISEAQFDKVQAMLKENVRKRAWKSRDSSTCSHWLVGIIRCPECGTTYVYVKGYNGRADRFRCGRYGNASCKNAHTVSVKNIEKLVLSVLETATPETVRFVKSANVNNKIEDVSSKNIKQLEKALERAKSAYLDGVDTLDEYKVNKTRIVSEINSLIEAYEPESINPVSKNAFRERITGLVEILRSDCDNKTKNIEIRQDISKILPDLKANTYTFYFFE